MGRILVVSLAGIGDTLCAVPLIEELRHSYPNATIDVLVMWKGSQQILENNPQVDNVIFYPFLEKGYIKGPLFCLGLRKRKYNLVINSYPQSQFRYRVVSWLIGGKKFISHFYDNHSFLDNLLVTKGLKHDYSKHCIDNNLDLLKLIGLESSLKDRSYRIYLSKGNKAFAKNFIKNNKLKNHHLFGFHVGSGTTKNLSLKRWPLDYYEKFIRKLLKNNPRMRVLLFGGPKEFKENTRLLENLDSDKVILVESKHILDAAALVKECKYFLSVDGVMMHIAAAVGVPNQITIRSAAYSDAVKPYRDDFIEVGNDLPKGIYYKFDAHGIYGRREDIISYIRSITVDQVYRAFKRFKK